MRVLAIETSCDETGIALIEAEGEFGDDFHYRVLGNALTSQAALHAQFGGVFPNLAKREHIKNLPLLLPQALQEGTLPDVIAVTVGPGLEPCLWAGITFAQKLALQWRVPVVAIDHMEGHIVLSMMEKDHLVRFDFPVLALLISGGHSELVLSASFEHYEVIGRTRDDAAGEAFDKVARLLELPYPGGPEISRLARQARCAGLPRSFELPRPMLHEENYDFSFSGLKTAVRRIVGTHQGGALTQEEKMEIAREFEDAVADVLVEKTLRAIDSYGGNTVAVGGGVSANEHIRYRLREALAEAGNIAQLLVPPPELATDNALMIALAGYFRALKKEFTDPEKLTAAGNRKLC